MASALPRIRKHEDSGHGDSSRHGHGRDYYVNPPTHFESKPFINSFLLQSSRDDRRDGRDRGARDDHRGERRRSRSPGGHRSSRGSRREMEVDSYSSSRDYRAREREDRYRDPREDRAWDRDRHGARGDFADRGMDRRDARRDDDRRPPRGGDRELFDNRHDRRGGGGGGGRDRERGDQIRSDRDEFAMQMGGRDRKKSMSPPPKKKEPTPDLTDIIPITERKRRLTQWDLKPPGYENVTAEQAKLSGMFPLPGAPRQQPMDPSKLQAFMNQPSGSASHAALKPSNARQSKRLYVQNLPASADEEAITGFFNLQMNGLNVIEGIDPCISCQISKDRGFAMVEFKTPGEATLGLCFDGVSMEDAAMGGQMENGGGGVNGNATGGLSVRRPKDYIVPTATDEGEHQEGVISSVVPDTQNKISVTNIPTNLTDEQIVELLATFGELRAFVLVKDRGTEESRVSLLAFFILTLCLPLCPSYYILYSSRLLYVFHLATCYPCSHPF